MTGGGTHVLVVITKADEVTRLSLRNAHGVHLLESGQLNTRDVLVSDHVVFTQEALDSFVARATGDSRAPAGNDGAAAAQAPDAARRAGQAPAAESTRRPSERDEEPKPKATRAKAKQEDDSQ